MPPRRDDAATLPAAAAATPMRQRLSDDAAAAATPHYASQRQPMPIRAELAPLADATPRAPLYAAADAFISPPLMPLMPPPLRHFDDSRHFHSATPMPLLSIAAADFRSRPIAGQPPPRRCRRLSCRRC